MMEIFFARIVYKHLTSSWFFCVSVNQSGLEIAESGPPSDEDIISKQLEGVHLYMMDETDDYVYVDFPN